MDSTAFAVLGTCAIPKPRARDFASGLHYPLALALTLTRPFREAERKVFGKIAASRGGLRATEAQSNY